MTNDIAKVESDFYRSLGNGKNGAKLLAIMATHVVASGDTMVMCRAIGRAQSKGDENAANLVKRVLAALYPDGKAKTGKQFAYKIAGTGHDAKVLAALVSAGEKDLSIRGAAWKTAVFGKAAPKSAHDKLHAAMRAAFKSGMPHAEAQEILERAYGEVEAERIAAAKKAA